MYKCSLDDADIVIDGQGYQLETERELSGLLSLQRLRGIELKYHPSALFARVAPRSAKRVSFQEETLPLYGT